MTKETSFFDGVPVAPPDKVLKTTVMYRADPHPDKIDLGVGAYRDENGRPWVLPVVRKVKKMILEDPSDTHEYLSVIGHPPLVEGARRLALGPDSPAIKEKRCASIQTISGTGANFLGGLYLSKYFRQGAKILISDPSWLNHTTIFENLGFEVAAYRYYDPVTVAIDIDGMIESLREAEDESVVILQVCAHNPTGIDPTPAQWARIADVMQEKHHFPFFDCAYQGFASGDLDRDVYSLRLFINRGMECSVAQSFAKNMGLYGERCGCYTVVTQSPARAEAVQSQLNRLARAVYSTSPAFGAKIAGTILNSPELLEEWKRDLNVMAGRIKKMRTALYEGLVARGTPGSWNHIVDQIGMFSYTGLRGPQVKQLVEEHHVYMLESGRISMAGLNPHNVQRFVGLVDSVVRNVKL